MHFRKPAILLVAFWPTFVWSQLSGYNLLQYQLGSVAGDTLTDYSAHYDRLHLNYQYKNIKLSADYEQALTDFDSRNYQQLSRFQFQYQKQGFMLKAGNFTETLGRGLLLRAYEIPASVYEDRGWRVPYGFYKDVRGVLGAYKKGDFTIKLLRGTVLNNTVPPVLPQKQRREDLIEAADLSYKIQKQTIGFTLLRHKYQLQSNTYASASIKGLVGKWGTYYTELAQQLGGGHAAMVFPEKTAFAFYSGLNASYQKLGASIEIKKYHHFLLGASAFNDPPSAVKEHSYKLLNRATHLSDPYGEQGYQLELFYLLPNAQMLTFNHSWAKTAAFRDFLFREYFLEAQLYPIEGASIKLFVDYAQDQLKGERDRVSAGLVADYHLPQGFVPGLELETQRAQRYGTVFYNHVVVGSLSRGSKASISVLWELSNDPFYRQSTSFRHWLGASVSYRFLPKHQLTVFAGKRRGGPACTSGICYETLDFEGVELRLSSKF